MVSLVILILNGCDNRKSPETALFNKFLSRYNEKTIQEEPHIYLIIDEGNGCSSCAQLMLEAIETYTFDSISTSIILSGRNIRKHKLEKFNEIKIVLDTVSCISRINLGLFGSGLLYTSNCEIDSSLQISHKNIERVISLATKRLD